MIRTALEDWRAWLKDFEDPKDPKDSYTMLPLIVAHPLDQSRPIAWDLLWEQAGPDAFVLESGKGGRYTFLGLQPVSILRGKGDQALVTEQPMETPAARIDGKPLPVIKQWMATYRAPKVEGAPKFCGGCVGFLGYDVIRSIEKLPVRARDDLGIPDYVMMRFNEVWIIDHEDSRLYCVCHTAVPQEGEPCLDEAWLQGAYAAAIARVGEMKRRWDVLASVNQDEAMQLRHACMRKLTEAENMAIDPERLQGVERAFNKEAFMQAVERIRNYIGQGDVFQVNLSVRQSKQLSVRPELIYEWLRVMNPSPYMAFLRLGDFQLVSASPELLVQVDRGRVRTRPIAGTRKRGATPDEDLRMRDELLANEKERAEHIMLVDLERNDLGRVSRYGTVKVTELMAIEYYSHVMHIVSEITGELQQGKDIYDVIAATFPGGTITGAPKIRTMEIIEELEPVRRGPYTGSIGWIDYTGDMELNIVIRTMAVVDGRGYVQAGAGIVIDSIPEREYKESLNKAKALWKAIELSEQFEAEAAQGSR